MDCLDILCDVVQGRWCCLSRPLSYGFARMRAPCIIVVVGCVRVVCEEGRGVRENAQMERRSDPPRFALFGSTLALVVSRLTHGDVDECERAHVVLFISTWRERERERAGCRCAHSTDVPCAPQPPSCRPRRFVLRRRRRRSSSARTYVNPPIRFTAPLVCNGGLFIARPLSCM